ncbi:MAG: hypothetical protein Q9191_007800 [Dirinaria sp. TL-2023a]
MGCDHEAGIFCKRKFKDSSLQQSILTPPCALCKIVYPFWKDYAAESLVSSKSIHIDESQLDGQNQAAATVEYGAVEPVKPCGRELNFDELYLNPPALDDPKNKLVAQFFQVELQSKQIGEAYHVLVCGLLLRYHPFKMRVLFEEKEGIEQILDLFDWYKIDTKPEETNGLSNSSKKKATKVIAAAFRTSITHRTPSGHVKYNQPALFRHLRSELKTPGADLVKCRDLHRTYLQPTYAAKYWLNRYLSLTGQGKLPKKDDASRLAVIHMRGSSALTPGPRQMDSVNLKHVVESIAHANQLAQSANESCFTHIILYGDFDHSEVDERKRLVETALRRTKPSNKAENEVKLLFISRPWESNSIALQGKCKEVAELWRKFRDLSFDHLPIQVKILAIWTTLCERYDPKMCVIGHRSGFIEGAGFIGIPVFYLNNEREDLYFKSKEGGEQKFQARPGDLLWKTPENSDQDRLRELAEVMDTFIPIEALKSEDKGFVGIYQVEDKYKDELSAALFMYMCCDVATGLDLQEWPFSNLQRTHPINPGWTARVDMMRDKCEGHEPGEKGCKDDCHLENEDMPQTGQEWLRRRYLFATHARTIRLSHWSGVMTEKWTGTMGMGTRTVSGEDVADLVAAQRASHRIEENQTNAI